MNQSETSKGHKHSSSTEVNVPKDLKSRNNPSSGNTDASNSYTQGEAVLGGGSGGATERDAFGSAGNRKQGKGNRQNDNSKNISSNGKA